ncbi:YrrS family protein [Alteribacillus bidgolensis]|uniref:DUF1510 domain-containing protein n=1 Tax=Alteribacillus bidgolensis TaxID=930129 RepID=A0A1G8NAT5_9BACI|nr:YrrS family protein [Alteribacillus bidgolensis]SDI77196.1 Protein of unknown function [Alteribacillus bidgolensis]
MNNDNNRGFGEDTRYEMRKRKRMNRILNASIVAVGGLIIFFAVQLFFSGNDQAVEENETDNIAEEAETEPVEETEEESENVPEEAPETDTEESKENSDTDEIEENSEEPEEEPDGPQIPEGDGESGEWEPIGTEQSGSFSHDFNKGSQNWKEMKMALRYATNLDETDEDDIRYWRIENGGDSHTVVGIISDKNNENNPYHVTMEFIENEGWKPIEVKVLDSNPHN